MTDATDDTAGDRDIEGRLRRYLRADDGRVPMVSAGISGLFAAAVVGSIGTTTGTLSIVTLGAIAGVLGAVGVALIGIRRPIASLLGAIALVVALGCGQESLEAATRAAGIVDIGLFGGAAILGYGVARFRVDAFGGRALMGTLGWLLRVSLLIAPVGLAIAAANASIGRVVGVLIRNTRRTLQTSVRLEALDFGIAFVGASIGLLIAVATLPLDELVPADATTDVQSYRSRGFNWILLVGVGGTLLPIVYVILIENPVGDGPVQTTLVSIIGVVVLTDWLRTALYLIGGLSILVTVVTLIVRRIGGLVVAGQSAWIAPGLAVTIVVTGLARYAGPNILNRVTDRGVLEVRLTQLQEITGPTPLVLGSIVLGMWLFVLVGGVVIAVTGNGLLPGRYAGARLSLLGGWLLVSAAAARGAPIVVTVGAAVATIVLWDVAEHGSNLVAAVGDEASHQTVTLIHAGGSLAVGGFVLASAWGLRGVLVGIRMPAVGALPALLSGLVGTVVLLTLLRG